MKKSRRKPTLQTEFFNHGDAHSPFPLQSGQSLPGIRLAYETYGTLADDASNAILLFHAMTGSQHACGFNPAVDGVGERWTEECQTGWWDRFIGPGKALDTSRFFIVCANYLGGCYGSTGPASTNPATGRPYGSAFPKIALADIVHSQSLLLDYLGIGKLHAVVGGSIGGMLCLSFATLHPERVRHVIPIGTGMEVTPLQRLLNFEQAYAIESDPAFRAGDYYDGKPPLTGLAHARLIAHKTFISLQTLTSRARREIVEGNGPFQSYQVGSALESYMLHQGKKFVQRFDANSYLRILEAWQNYDLAGQAGADSLTSLFSNCRRQNYLVFSIDSDVSFYPEEQEFLTRTLKRARVPVMRITVHSEKGHDSFLLEPELYTPHLHYILKS